MSSFSVPIIDVSALFGSDSLARKSTADAIGKACAEVGFFVIINHQIPEQLVKRVWTTTQNFFDSPEEEKLKLCKAQEEYPFGFTSMGGEVLSAGKAVEKSRKIDDEPFAIAPPDLKEMFSIGPSDPRAGFPARIFPTEPADFELCWSEYYSALAQLAQHILRAFALALGLPDENHFDQFIDHHASAMRAINYPAIPSDQKLLPSQLRASAHTDYGTITILKSDGPGLQVSKDTEAPVNWVDVPHVEGGFIINLGDLMRRWTNDKWLSTLHRVVIPSSEVTTLWDGDGVGSGVTGSSDRLMTRRRQSIAFFHNLNRDAVVSVLLHSEEEVAKHDPIIAGEFLMQKHLASIQSVK